MKLCRGAILAVALSVLPLAGCGVAGAQDQREFRGPFPLAELIAAGVEQVGPDTGVEIRMEVRGADGAVVPYALVQLDWGDGGRTAFQSDVEGVFWIRFPPFALDSEAVVSLRTIPHGTDFVVEDYASFSRPLEGGVAAVRFSSYVPAATRG
ncbi:hypothetical protein [Engelhardtia mirabilis]|uniref:Carboxypeptidase regulatory-like domain-containing protein n=1 Tax=Engelhardtia mirabilis TaxID=2528011 RepID=A0A518BJ15_9BACT|nr:hypothetical protein Pla133_20340 [Planctomycetes bacterium Pla133]QDV01286.1 hypothetical protein Pla86_20350 [Planctomycetes bacterium Pla86]